MVADTTSQVSTYPRSAGRARPGSGGEPGARTPRSVSPLPLTAAALSPARLGQLVREIAAAGESWQPIVHFSAERRWYRRLVLAEDHEIWLLSWLPGQHTGFHDHGEARGAFAVAQGELRETLAQPGRNRVRNRCAPAGSVTTFGASHLHDVSNVTTTPAVSVHAYSPPLTAMRRYEMTASGLALAGTDRAELDW